MARTQVRKAVKKAAAKKAARKSPAKATIKRKAVAAKKAAPARKVAAVRKSAPVKAARKASRKAAQKVTRKGARKTDLRVVAADGQPVKAPKMSAKDRRLDLVKQFNVRDDERDTSMFIVDYVQLRTEAIRAMGGDIESASAKDLVEVEGVQVVRGSFATEAKGVALYQKIKAQKKGPGTLVTAHPLDFHVLTGNERINTRDFSTPDMIERVAALTYDIAVNNVQVSVHAFAREDLLYGKDGETRFRAVLHAWILKARGIVPDAPLSIPITLTAKGTNDANIQLDVIKGNQVKNLKPLEVAEGILKAFKLGKSVEAIAKYMGEKKGWVDGMIAAMDMPERVQNMIRQGDVTIPFAWRVWEQEKQHPDRTVATIEYAVRQSKAQGSTRAMPKHLPPKADAPAPTPRKTTAKAPVEAAAVNGEAANDEVTAFGDALRTGLETGETTVVDTTGTGSTVTVDVGENQRLRELLQQGDTKIEALEKRIIDLTGERDALQLKADKSDRLEKSNAALKKENGELKRDGEKLTSRHERMTKHLDNVGAVMVNCPVKDTEDGMYWYGFQRDQVVNVLGATWGDDAVPQSARDEPQAPPQPASNEDNQNEAAA